VRGANCIDHSKFTGEETLMAVQAISKSVLITGCSTGIGRATAPWLSERGWKVYATARRRESLADLEGKVATTLPLDVCDEASMASAVRTIEEKDGAVGVLVNNAGYGQEGAFEEVAMDKVREQFETNVFGLTRLTQLVLPGMRRQG
jgi:NADP-dependent 3-hydroxy acid dehydrogenase YdfG